MSDDQKNEGLEDRTLSALSRLPRAQASDSARERARLAFVQGSAVAKPRSSSRPMRRMVAMLMAAVLGVVAVLWFGVQPDQEWVVLDVVNPAGVSSGGQTIAVGTRLNSGDLSTAADSEVEVQLGSSLRFRLLPGTSLTLPKAPGRWFNRSRQMPLTSGEIYGTSGGQKLDFDLVFNTTELEARLTGTTFAVFRTDTTSCVCLWEGSIEVTPLVGPADLVDLEEKTRVWIYRDGREPAILPLSGMETMKLQMTEDNGLATELPPRR